MADGASFTKVCDQIIQKQKNSKKIRRDNDVLEVCLSDRKLEAVCDFSKLPNLKYLWLSNNRLRSVDCLRTNYKITELHLQYNLLKDITGALAHLTQMQVLMLQGNQLTNLEKVIKEFRKMQNLQILNMFDNPLAQEKDYRHYTIFQVPSVKILDRKEVQDKEKHQARKAYDQDNEMVRDKIAFLRCSQGPPDLYYKRRHDFSLTTAASPLTRLQYRPTSAELQEEVEARVRTKALWTYNYFDWLSVSKPEERRLRQAYCKPEMLSVTFK